TRCSGWPRSGRRHASPGGAAGRGAADRTAPCRPVAPVRWSGAEHAGDGLGGFLDLGVDLVAALDGRVGDAVAQVLLQQLQGEGLQGLGGGGHLGEYVDAVDVLVDHALQAADLSLDAAQAFEVFLLLVVVAVDPAVVVGDDVRRPVLGGGRSGAGLGGRHRVLLWCAAGRGPVLGPLYTPGGYMVPNFPGYRPSGRCRARRPGTDLGRPPCGARSPMRDTGGRPVSRGRMMRLASA